jgi:hypothetical protein
MTSAAMLLIGLWAGSIVLGCGTVGPPVPPQDIGVGAKISREEMQTRRLEKERRAVDVVPSTDPARQESLLPAPGQAVQPSARPSADSPLRSH